MRMLCVRFFFFFFFFFFGAGEFPPNLSAHHSLARLSRVNIDIVSRIFVCMKNGVC